MMLNGLDLFSGIGGLTSALREWVVPIAYCELDPYARGVLLSRMADGQLPVAPIWDDVRTLDGTQFRGAVDIIYGGFPCQDISVAGNGEGLEGKRSGLFFEIVRLAEEIRPTFLFLENVPAIRGRGLSVVVKELASLRYDARWGCLAAYDVGAPHKRERWWLLAHASSDKLRLEQGWRSGESRQGTAEPGVDGASQPMAYAYSDWWAAEPDVGRVAYGVSKRVDRLRGLGNAVVPQQAREAFEKLMGLSSS